MFAFLLQLILIILILTATSASIIVIESDPFGICFSIIIDRYFHYRSNVFLGPRFEEINFSSSKPLKILDPASADSLKRVPGTYTFSYRNTSDLNHKLTDLRQVSNLDYYTVIANNKSELLEVAEILWQFQLHKSIMLLRSESKVIVYGMDLKNSKCGTKVKLKKINQCTGTGFERELNLFNPDMRKDFNKCPIRIIWSKYTPWIFHPNDTETGIYRDMLSILDEKSNFSIKYMPDSSVYTEELAHYNFASIIADFNADYADVFVGLVAYTASSPHFWNTGVIYDDNMYFVVPNPKMIPYWKLFGQLFPASVWVGGAVYFLLLCGLFAMLARAEAGTDRDSFGYLANNVFYFYSLTYTVGCYKTPKSSKLRLFLGTYLFSTIIIVAAFQGKYFSVMSRPLYEKRITDIDQLLDSGVPIKSSEGLRLLFLLPFNERNRRVLQQMQALPSQDLAVNLKRAYQEGFATITDKGLLIMNPYLRHAMQLVEITSFVTCFLMKRNHVLYEYFTLDLTRIVESGFVDKSVSEMKYKYTRRQYFRDEDRTFQLTVDSIQGPIFILAAGLFAASICFVLEHIYFHCIKARCKLMSRTSRGPF